MHWCFIDDQGALLADVRHWQRDLPQGGRTHLVKPGVTLAAAEIVPASGRASQCEGARTHFESVNEEKISQCRVGAFCIEQALVDWWLKRCAINLSAERPRVGLSTTMHC